jgi:phosphoribosyl-AMP cyclohydrolase
VTETPIIAHWVDYLRTTIPGTVAIFLKGSHARGDAGPHSDFDFDVLTDHAPAPRFLAYLDETDGNLIHISVAIFETTSWLAYLSEPVPWSFSLSAVEAARLLWHREDAPAAILEPTTLQHPPGDPELEDFVADFGKVKNAYLQGDELALRLAAQGLAHLSPTLLRLINPPVYPGTHYQALVAVLDFPIAPPSYREDMLTCLGLSGRATTVDDVYAAASRIATGVITLLRLHAVQFTATFEPDLPTYLASGTLQRYLEQGT